ncbi:hypothetical protein [Saccharopolyspora hattusasensis]|uniref:hypothetical protein n=1 Tax=Saccharopolyspora hattusasensis TaxID=1128679 RepID=UPI003D99A8FF
MSETATPIDPGTNGVRYVEGDRPPEAAAEVERLDYTAGSPAGPGPGRSSMKGRSRFLAGSPGVDCRQGSEDIVKKA